MEHYVTIKGKLKYDGKTLPESLNGWDLPEFDGFYSDVDDEPKKYLIEILADAIIEYGQNYNNIISDNYKEFLASPDSDVVSYGTELLQNPAFMEKFLQWTANEFKESTASTFTNDEVIEVNFTPVSDGYYTFEVMIWWSYDVCFINFLKEEFYALINYSDPDKVDIEELTNHLSNNNYMSMVMDTRIYVTEDEFYEVKTILNDRNINYDVTFIGE